MPDQTTSPPPLRPTPAAAVPQVPAAATLSRDLADFLVELQIALHKHAIYPADHPLVRAAVAGVTRRLAALFLERSALSIGVARRQLVIEGVATDPDHPLLRELAQRLHRHYLGALKLSAGLTPEELAEVLSTIAAEPGRGSEALGSRLAEVNAAWQHVRLFPVTFDQLELVDDGDEGDAGMRASRAAQLWMGLARAAMAAEASADEPNPDADSAEPVAVARAIEHHQRETAYDQVVVGYLLQIAQEIRHANGRESAALQRRISRLVGSLTPETLAALLEMGGDTRQRRNFVLDVTQGMSVDAVVEVARAAAIAERRTISTSMLRMLSKLAAHAEHDGGGRRADADEAVRDHVVRLVGEWALKDPNPDAYRSALDDFARRAQGAAAGEPGIAACEPERVIAIALEVGAVGPTVMRAVDELLARGADGVRQILALTDIVNADAPSSQAVKTRLVEGDALAMLLEEARPDAPTIACVAALAGPRAVAPLLDSLDTAPDAVWLERLCELAPALADAIGAEAARRAPRADPSTLRQLLALLGRLRALPRGFTAEPYMRHADPLVRREAARLALREQPLLPTTTWTRALRTAVIDEDPRVVHVGLVAAAGCCPAEVVPALRARVDGGELDAALRAHAVRVLAARRDPTLVPWFVQRVITRSRWLKRPRLRAISPELLAAIAALGAHWRSDPRAQVAIDLAAASRDAEVRHALAAGEQRLSSQRAVRVAPTTP